ncbi:4-(cytidine 5'-diphospho)-2-C-methyl-D-erythritol kinase [Corynebacterium urealyticum]|uniref:4-diphosphocytidyl-2-C-methyl-D-erythritol kinase n=1 Tax=Corynebacterium urealyticum (strain ATCC 43042 / DSM 7109) TaxID=504474 RepID=B1VFI5_CORU7|nr:4-(cytidine 5'-diphospho)-2-C-methyl-D-erythritol kinase [Corynebacterium urealyticum]QQC41985.1 4-(cytidine 5'-diphospho)-2-C-methyl-D-erythritol kinase [Corynebacterium urealyticum]QQE50609.1 4-(cytidine 5'-diphospho)-2-C-methyl-D-erythritol kinase [Corynebacterium urealyticum]CAQ04524.1 4-diphosphocytidyl-2-C-methyl-D-erythritol kinase [Corynebacterium urealyticum DSM 7109]SNV95956.1 4-diphosphocytidyl-2-C-methyl-D-erythritol kinase [Corynebacterium urealyticum]
MSTQHPGDERGDTPRISVAATAHGKINLHLGVGDVRPDGYHELETIFQAVSLTETVTLTAVPRGAEPELTVAGPDAHLVPRDPSNLAWRAVELVRDLWCERAGLLEDPAADPATRAPLVSIHIDKNVPVAGGMAGGSADAAAALVAAVEFYFGRQPLPYPTPRKAVAPSQAELLQIAATLGADVPFCVLGGTALGTARGDELISIMSQGPYHWAIATDKRGLSTPQVFAQLDRQREAARTGNRPDIRAQGIEELMRALVTGDPHQLAPLLVNDLQAPAISLLPSLRQTLAVAKEAGALAAIVSGSGPSIAMLCEDEASAVEVATAVSVAGKASATVVTSSPAPGARVVRS